MTVQRIPDDRAPELLWDPATGDVICDRIVTMGKNPERPLGVRQRWNIIQQLWYWPAVGMTWGDDSLGSRTMALAVLDIALLETRGAAARLWSPELPCNPLALLLAPCYAAEVVNYIPYWGCVLRGTEIREWIEERLQVWQEHAFDGPAPHV